MSGTIHRVFVYGTLKRGHGNHEQFLKNAYFAGECATPPHFEMIAASFPVILTADPCKAVAGELYHVDDEVLARLDALERVPTSYRRAIIDVTENGRSVQAYVYIGTERWSKIESHRPYTSCNKRGELDWKP
jgi:gamma-glutamylcyclotransferase (GGCT)/AIG2-like uncharacterized protein YtfP